MKSLKLLSIIAAFTTAGVLTSQAGDADLLNKLVEKGVLSQSEAAHLADGSSHTVFKAKGKHTKKVRFNGRLQFQYDYLNADDDANTVNADRSQFYFRRLFLGAKGYLADDWAGEIVMDFANQAAGIDKAVISYTGFEGTDINFGWTKVPFGMEETTSSSKLKPIERSAANRLFADDLDFGARHSGIHVNGDVIDTGLSYAVSLTNGAQGESDRASGVNNSKGFGVFGRLEYTFDLSDHGSLLIGGDAGFRSEDTTATANYAVMNSSITAYNLHAKYKYDAFELAGEYYWGELEDERTGVNLDQDVESWYLQAAYKFENWEPVIRYSAVDMNDNAITQLDADDLIRRAPGDVNGDNELTSWYLGLTYYVLGDDLKVQAGYEWAETEQRVGNNDLEINGFRGRIQLLF